MEWLEDKEERALYNALVEEKEEEREGPSHDTRTSALRYAG
jgi:hypothetical protein